MLGAIAMLGVIMGVVAALFARAPGGAARSLPALSYEIESGVGPG